MKDLWVPDLLTRTPSDDGQRGGRRSAPAPNTACSSRRTPGEIDQLSTGLYLFGKALPGRLGLLSPPLERLCVHLLDVDTGLFEHPVDANVVLLRGGVGELLQLGAHVFKNLLLFGGQLFEPLHADYKGLEHKPECVATRGRSVSPHL